MTTHRDEALKALEHVIDRLASADPIDGLTKYQLKASLEFAREAIGKIQEVKRTRKNKDLIQMFAAGKDLTPQGKE